MASAKIVNLSQYTGEKKAYQDTITTSTGGVQDITGWTITFTIHEAGNPLNVFVGPITTTHINDPGGVCEADLATTDTVNMIPTGYEHVWKRTDSSYDNPLTVGAFTLLRR